jgi:hypothetical protein
MCEKRGWLAKEKSSKKEKVEILRILDALIRQANSFLGSDIEIPRKVVSIWHAKARAIIAKVAGRNSKEAAAALTKATTEARAGRRKILTNPTQD